jgi:two-component system chemotaxis response regulator CheY
MSPNPFRILVVDDSAHFRRQVRGALEASGLTVLEASEGSEALWRARSERAFDLVLVDVHMPNLDGITFLREIRKLPGYAEVPIIVVTSDGSRARRVEGRHAGATAWLLKPPDLPGLVNSVHAALMRIRVDGKPNNPSSRTPNFRPPDLGTSKAPQARPALPPRSERAPVRSQRVPLLPAPAAALSLDPRPKSADPRAATEELRPQSAEPRSRPGDEPRPGSRGPGTRSNG